MAKYLKKKLLQRLNCEYFFLLVHQLCLFDSIGKFHISSFRVFLNTLVADIFHTAFKLGKL